MHVFLLGDCSMNIAKYNNNRIMIPSHLLKNLNPSNLTSMRRYACYCRNSNYNKRN